MEKKISVLLVDDHTVVRAGFRLMLEATEDIEVTAEAESGEAAYASYSSLPTDVVIMDLAMAGIGGIEAIKRIVARDKKARILALSAHEDVSYPRRALAAGARGYLSKRTAPEVLIEAVRAIAAGRSYIDAAIAQRMAIQEAHGGSNAVEQLSEREFEVFVQLAKGLTVNQIADTFHLSPSTIGTHLYNIKQKLGASNQAELTLIAVRNGLIEA